MSQGDFVEGRRWGNSVSTLEGSIGELPKFLFDVAKLRQNGTHASHDFVDLRNPNPHPSNPIGHLGFIRSQTHTPVADLGWV